jgi:hypothetical protein
MLDEHQRFENRLHAIARRHFSRHPGVHHVSLGQLAALGHGDMAAGEIILHRLFDGHMVGPRSIAASGVRAAGGRKVLQRFFDRADKLLANNYQAGGAVEPDELADVGAIPKAGQTVPSVNARPMTGQAAMTALGIPDISAMTDEEQQMFALGAIPMLAAGPEAKIAEEAAPEIAQAVKQGIRAFHGSPYDFERFDLSKIGSGEGAQAYGHGLYFAEHPQVAEEYKEALRGGFKWTVDGEPVNDPDKQSAINSILWATPGSPSPVNNPIKVTPEILARAKARHLQKLGVSPDATEYLKEFEGLEGKTVGAERPRGHGYEVNIAADPEHFLDWDRPLSEQPAIAEKLGGAHGPITGEGLLKLLGDREHAAEYLRSKGIPGIRYLDQGSRDLGKVEETIDGKFGVFDSRGLRAVYPTKQEAEAATKGTSNYVVFDDSLISILKKYGLAGLIAAGAAHFKLPADQESEPEQHASGGKVRYSYERVPLKRYARGGKVKMTKADAGYHDCADSGRICAVCDMFKEPNGCTLVRGDISRTASCDHFEKT